MQPYAEGVSITDFDHLFLTLGQFYHGHFSPHMAHRNMVGPYHYLGTPKKELCHTSFFCKHKWLQHLPAIPPPATLPYPSSCSQPAPSAGISG